MILFDLKRVTVMFDEKLEVEVDRLFDASVGTRISSSSSFLHKIVAQTRKDLTMFP